MGGAFGAFRNLFGGSKPTPQTFNPADTIGAPGFRAYNGQVQSEERDPDMASSRRFQEFSEMLANTPIIAASCRYFLNLLSKSGWNIEPSDPNSAAAKEMADWLWDTINDMDTPWSRVVRRAGMFTFHGFQVQEWTSKRREDGSIGLLDIEARPQVTIERWEFDPAGRVIGAWQRVPQSGREVFLPRHKIVYLVDDAMADTPIGIGLFRHLVEPHRRLAKFQLLEAYAFETNLRGTPLIRMPIEELQAQVKAGTLSDAEYKLRTDGVRRLVHSHFRTPSQGFMFDSATYRDKGEDQSPSSVAKWSIELLTGDAAGLPENAAAINRLNREMAIVLGTEGLLLGNENGTQALSRDKSHSFSLRVEATQTEMAEGFEKDIRDQLWDLNGFDPKLKPKMKPDPIQFRDPAQLTQAILDLSQAGAVLLPNDPVINVIRGVLGLPAAPEMEEMDPEMLPRPRAKPDDTGPAPRDPNSEDDQVDIA